MAVQTYPYLALSDGTTTVTIQDGLGGLTNYPMIPETWAPRIAQLSVSQIGTSPYDPVVEELQIAIRDTTAALALDRLATLETLLDQADRWWRGENQTPVTVQFAPQGSTLASTAAPYKAVILGRAGGQGALVDLPNAFARVGINYEISPVTVRFVRRPQWILGTTAASSGAVANPGIMTTTLANLAGFAPAKISVAGLKSITISTAGGSALYMLSSCITNGLQVIDLPQSTGGAFSSVADSAAAAYGGNVLRYTPAGTSEATIGAGTLASSGFTGIGSVYAAVRNNGSTTYRLRWGVYDINSFSSKTTWARPVPIDASTAVPRIVPLGSLAVNGVSALQLGITASAASSTLDLDYLVIVIANSYSSGVARFIDRLDLSVMNNTAAVSYDPRTLTAIGPRGRMSGTDTGPTAYSDDSTIDAYVAPHVTGTTVLTTLLGTTSARWVLAPSGTSGASLTTTVTRDNAYLTPA